MSAAQNKILARRFYEEVWIARDPTAAFELVTPGCVRHDPVGPVPGGPEGFNANVARVRTGLPDLQLSIDLILADLKDQSYPAGPYAQAGNVNVGDVLPDFTFQGYFSPNSTMGLANAKPYGEVTFGMLHDSGAKYAIVVLSAFW